MMNKPIKIKDKSNTKGKVLLRLRDNTGMIVKKALGNNALSKFHKAKIVFDGSDGLDGGSAYMMGKTHISNNTDAIINTGSTGVDGLLRHYKTIPRQNADF